MNMMLNSLPSRTWNRLGMNESFIDIQDKPVNRTPETDFEGRLWNPDYKGEISWSDMKTGVGNDITEFVRDADAEMIETEENFRMQSPIVLKYNYNDSEKAASRLYIHAAKNSLISVIILMSSPKESEGVAALQTKIYAEENSRVDIYTAQILGNKFVCFSDFGGVCDDNAEIRLTKLELGSEKLYAGAHVDLKGKECYFKSDIGYHCKSNHLMDMNYVALHHGQKTNSLMEVCGTLEEDAKKIFRGSIDFQQGCAGSKGTESENVLLLGDNMVNQTIPLILCKEEDVEGNHGASIGRLDDKLLFYLGTRGISEDAAQEIIAESRIESVCSKIPDEDIQNAVHEFQM